MGAHITVSLTRFWQMSALENIRMGIKKKKNLKSSARCPANANKFSFCRRYLLAWPNVNVTHSFGYGSIWITFNVNLSPCVIYANSYVIHRFLCQLL